MKFSTLHAFALALPNVLAGTIGERTIGFSDAANVQSFDNVFDWLDGFRCVSVSTACMKNHELIHNSAWS